MSGNPIVFRFESSKEAVATFEEEGILAERQEIPPFPCHKPPKNRQLRPLEGEGIGLYVGDV